jgi:hypothetical protein
LFREFAVNSDPVRGLYIDNTNIAAVMFHTLEPTTKGVRLSHSAGNSPRPKVWRWLKQADRASGSLHRSPRPPFAT